MTHTVDVIGVGAALVDVLAHVPDAFVAALSGGKGGMELIDRAARGDLLGRLPADTVRAPGGSAANTIHGLAMLGARTSFLGKLGDDRAAADYTAAFARAGIDTGRLCTTAATPTGMCVVLVTPNSERTCRTYLGAAGELAPTDVGPATFAACRLAHVEGYSLFNRSLTERVLAAAREADCQVSLDLGSFEVVEQNRAVLPELLRDYVDIVFANEDEAAAFCGEADPATALAALGEYCDTAAVKVGAEGAWLQQNGRQVKVDGLPVRAVDTTGAGDLWAAGFLHGHIRGLDLSTCGRLGSLLGAEAVITTGARIDDRRWPDIRARACKLTADN